MERLEERRHAVIGIFKDIRDAQKAINDLHGADFPARSVKLLANDQDEHLDNNRTDSTWSRTYALVDDHLKGLAGRFFKRDVPEDKALFHPHPFEESGKGSADDIITRCYQTGHHLVVVYTESDKAKAVELIERDGGIGLRSDDDQAPRVENQGPAGARPYL